jgi:hypothetical protein
MGSVRGPSRRRGARGETRRQRSFVEQQATAPEPTFVSSPADRWVYRGAVIRTTRISSSRQLVEQRLRLFQIGGVEALGEPAINGCEQVARFGPPALFAPQPGEARRGAQLIGLCLLPSRDAQCLFEGALAFFNSVGLVLIAGLVAERATEGIALSLLAASLTAA